METRSGFKGNKAIAPLTPIIFPEEYNGKVIPAGSKLTLFGCGNGYIIGTNLDTSRALNIFCNSKKKFDSDVISNISTYPIAPVKPVLPSPSSSPIVSNPVAKKNKNKSLIWIVVLAVGVGIAAAGSSGGGGNGHTTPGGPTIP